MTIEPLRGSFENWRALLGHIMEDDDVERFVIVTLKKDGTMWTAHFEMTIAEIAYAALLLQKKAMEEI